MTNPRSSSYKALHLCEDSLYICIGPLKDLALLPYVQAHISLSTQTLLIECNGTLEKRSLHSLGPQGCVRACILRFMLHICMWVFRKSILVDTCQFFWQFVDVATTWRYWCFYGPRWRKPLKCVRTWTALVIRNQDEVHLHVLVA